MTSVWRAAFALALAASGLAAPLRAQVVLGNQVFVESPTGQRKAASAALRGDWVVYMITYRNNGQQRIANYTITHPLAPTAELVGEETEGALMSVDRGQSYAPLADLRVRNPDGSERRALKRDVTHLRWRIPIILEPGMGGEVGYRARLK